MDQNLESRIGKGARAFARGLATASFVVLLAVPPSALAQPTSKLFPIPGEQCSAAFDCLPADYGKTIAPFTSSIKSFKGRFIYSNATRDYQLTRTYRAWGMFPEPSTGKIYAMYGSTVAAWSEASFFAKTNGQPSAGPPAVRKDNDGELYVAPDYTFYAEAKGSGWKTYTADGQQRLFDIATDDRGYVYLATQEFGWGILRDTGAALTSVAQVFPLDNNPENPAGSPKTVRVVKSGSNYIAVVGWDAGFTVYDVTTPATPRKFAETPSVNGTASVLMATTNRGSVAVLDISYDKIKIFSAAQLAAGNLTSINVEASPTGTFKAIAADATHIWAVENLGRASPTFNLVKISPTTGAVERFPVVIPGRLEPSQQVFLEVSGGLAAIAGWAADGSRRSQTRLYDVRGAAPVEIPIADWFEAAYWVAPSGYVVPPGTVMSPIQALPYTYGGKTYLMYSLVGIGDVVEIQAGDSLDIRRVTGASLGTQNPKNPNRGLGPYYGDTVTFTSSFSGQTAPNVNWNFGNPGATGNTTTTSIGINVPYRYKGFTSSGAISATKTVTGTSATNSSINDSESVNLLVPSARIVHADGSITGTLISAGGSYAGPVVVDDNFYDASDGAVEGHSGIWIESIPSASATPVTRSPLTAHLVAGCGLHRLNFTARYQDSFDAVLPAVEFTALPFSAKARITSSNGSSVTLSNVGRTSTTGFKAGQFWTVQWELLSAGGSALDTKLYDGVNLTQPPVGSVPNYVVPKSTIAANPGSKVRLTITALSVSMADSGCSSHLMSSDIFLLSPDPKVNTGACTAATTLGNCTLSADSASNRDQTGWAYAWTVTGPSSVSTPATRTFTPTFPVPGTYSVSVEATDPAAGTSGNSLPAVSIEVTQPPCMPTPASTIYFSASASSINPGQSVTFDAKIFGTAYAWQDCDTLTWSWGDGTSSTVGNKNNALQVSHAFSSSGTFTVTLTVSNSAGAPRSSTMSIQVGSVAPPPPDPPPPGGGGSCSAPKAGAIFVGYTGPESGCRAGGTTPCKVSENVSFKVDTFGYTVQSCDSFSWKFGDGRTATGRTPSYAYTAAGTYTVELKVTNSAGSVTATGPLVVSGGVCNAPANDIKLGWVGLASGCDPTKTCSPGEKVRFYFSSASNYVLQACDSVTWDFGDGEKSTSKVVQIDHTFASNGPFQVSFAVANSTATITDLKTISFVPITKPVVSIQASSTTGEPGDTITFTGSAVSNAPLTSRLWRVLLVTGGTTQVVRTVANESAISQTFDTDGDYRVEYTASNSGGTSDPAVVDVTISNRKSFAFLLPVVARLDGLNGTKWRTDLQVFNTDPLNAPISLEFEFRGGAKQFKKTLSFDSSTKVYEDLLSILSAPAILNDAGLVIVRGSSASPPQMWTRVYTVDASGVGSYGQFVPSVPIGSTSQAAGSPGAYIVPGLEISSRFRSNLGIVNPSNQSVQATVTIADDSMLGFPIGQFSVDVGPYALKQIGNLDTLVPAIKNGKPFSVRIATTGNLPLVVYGSMIDMISNDPVYVPGIHESTQAGAEKQIQVVPGAGHLVQGSDTWRSDLVVYNSDTVPVRFNLSYYNPDGTKAAEALDQALGAGAFVQVEDVLRWPMLDKIPADSVGLLKVETLGTGIVRYPIILQRTYKDRGPLGTFGQGIPAITPSRPNVELNKPAFIAGVRSDPSFYTNLGLVAVGNTPSKVRVSLLDDVTGKSVNTWHYVPPGATAPVALNPNQSILVGNIVRAISAVHQKGTLKIEVIEGGPVWAYASVIAAADPSCNCTLPEHTFDPEYIPAVQQGTN